jgi:hypothetical protein
MKTSRYGALDDLGTRAPHTQVGWPQFLLGQPRSPRGVGAQGFRFSRFSSPREYAASAASAPLRGGRTRYSRFSGPRYSRFSGPSYSTTAAFFVVKSELENLGKMGPQRGVFFVHLRMYEKIPPAEDPFYQIFEAHF